MRDPAADPPPHGRFGRNGRAPQTVTEPEWETPTRVRPLMGAIAMRLSPRTVRGKLGLWCVGEALTVLVVLGALAWVMYQVRETRADVAQVRVVLHLMQEK